MRKVQQKKILELLQTLNEANAEMRRLFLRVEIPSVVQVLADCQEFAIQIGNYIESIEGEGTQTVALLEEYCGELYTVSVEVSDGAVVKSFNKRLEKILMRIESSVRVELKPNRIEVVFMPYKRAMSDSLESVWQAAMQDPQCDTYIVPLPYYDRIPGGAFGEMHYEGNLYPPELTITDWREYDVQARHPDIIFVHSPYDDSNYVTSIHPNFYNKKLKDFTDLLVYIPYFVCFDDVEEHFCVSAGTMYADKVIVQSEKIRRTYIRVFKEFEKKNSCKGLFGKSEDKFVALGTPKFDRLLSTKHGEQQIPDEWLKLIEKPDGSRKKVILYNTTISGLLNDNEKVLHKLLYVFNFFNNRDDAVLLWRPHPLNEVTYKSMRPQLLDEYKNIAEKYRQQGFGIYDDTPDLHRAIAISDAYYGDWSSLVAMYQCTGKPVMIADIEILQKEIRFEPNNFYVSGDSIWFSVRRINALFRMDKNDWVLELIGSFQGENTYIAQYNCSLYGEPAENNGVLYFPSFLTKEIAAYSLMDGAFEKVQYKKNDSEEEISRDFQGAVAFGGYVYFTPYLYPAIARMDVISKEISFFSDWVEPLNKLIGNVHDAFFQYPLVIEKHIYLAACGANAVVEFDMETCKSNVYEVGEKGFRYNGICFDGESYWLSPRHNTPAVKWNPQTGETKEFEVLYCVNKDIQYAFMPIVYCGGYVWLMPRAAQHAVKIDTHTNVVSIAEEFEIDTLEAKAREANEDYYFVKAFKDNIYAWCERKGVFIEYNCATGERREKVIRYSPEIISKLESLFAGCYFRDPAAMKTAYHCCYYEGGDYRLSNFIAYIDREHGKKEAEMRRRRVEIAQLLNVKADGATGQTIYDYSKNLVLG